MARKPFNWSLLDRYNLHSMLYTAGREIIGKKLSIKDFQKVLSSHIKANLPIKVIKKQYDYSQKPGLVYMGGTYYSDNDKLGCNRYIEIVLSYHPLDTAIKMTEYRWTRICSLFADTILHEVIHMRQYRSRNFKTIPGYESTAYYHKQRVSQEYYGDADEMGAFSFNIACDMIDRFGYDPYSIQKYMDSMQAKRHKKTTWHRYLSAFEWNHEHKKIRQMKRKVLHQLEYAYVGKPFRTTNHLTY
jgi:hypothetical protein